MIGAYLGWVGVSIIFLGGFLPLLFYATKVALLDFRRGFYGIAIAKVTCAYGLTLVGIGCILDKFGI